MSDSVFTARMWLKGELALVGIVLALEGLALTLTDAFVFAPSLWPGLAIEAAAVIVIHNVLWFGSMGATLAARRLGGEAA